MMKRDIKFRGKQRYTGKWIYGWVFVVEQVCRIQPQGYKEAWQEVDYETVGEYTGLKDKNGKEIYEGDVMKVTDPMEEEDNQCVVEWHDNNSCYAYQSQEGFGDFEVTSIGWAMQMEFDFEIIGNIYENPELLRT